MHYVATLKFQPLVLKVATFRNNLSVFDAKRNGYPMTGSSRGSIVPIKHLAHCSWLESMS